MSRLPIRLRVALLGALAGLLASLIVAGVALWRAQSLARDDLDQFLSLEASEVVALITVGGRFATLVDINPSVGPSQRIAMFDRTGNLLDATPTLPPIPDLTSEGSRFETLADPASGETMRAIVIPIDIGGERRILVLATEAAFVSERVLATARAISPLVLLGVVAIGALSYFITGLVLNPIARLTKSANELASSPGGRRLAVPEANDEIRSLATTLNLALDRIDAVMARQREFVAQASHELRAPLSRLAADLEYAARPTRNPREVALGFDALARHTEDMVRVADELLDLLEERSTTAEPQPLTSLIDEVLSHLVHRSSMVLDVRCDRDDVAVVCDPGQVAGAVRNLVDNAFEHGSEPVILTIDCDEAELRFVVEDAGPGIPAGLLPSIGRPFVRGDDSGRAGLGLAIVSRVAAQLEGKLSVEPGARSLVALSIPFAPAS